MELTAQHRKTALGFGALPMRGGLGLKAEHFAHVRDTRPDVGFFEVHAENHLVAGGPMLRHLAAVRADYPLTIHGVGLSIGSEAGLDEEHLKAVTALVQRFEPAVFSEHLAWSSHNSTHFNDLLPLPYNLPTLHRVCRHIDQIQNQDWDRTPIPLVQLNDTTNIEYFTQELGIPVYHHPIELSVAGKKILVGHGDGLGPGDDTYKVLKKVFTHPLAQWLFGWLHPDIGVRLAKAWSSNSRITNSSKSEQQFLGGRRRTDSQAGEGRRRGRNS